MAEKEITSPTFFHKECYTSFLTLYAIHEYRETPVFDEEVSWDMLYKLLVCPFSFVLSQHYEFPSYFNLHYVQINSLPQNQIENVFFIGRDFDFFLHSNINNQTCVWKQQEQTKHFFLDFFIVL